MVRKHWLCGVLALLLVCSSNAYAHDPMMAIRILGGMAFVMVVVPLILFALLKRQNRKKYVIAALASLPFIWGFAFVDLIGGSFISACIPWLSFLIYVVNEDRVQ